MTWDDWSDKEIGFALTTLIEDVNGWSLSEDGSLFYHCGIDGSGYFSVEIIDINNPADMWPIILENGISLIKFKSGYQAVSEGWNYIDVSNHCDINDCCIGADQFDCGHENAFRAAAIVFLMMKGVKQDERI